MDHLDLTLRRVQKVPVTLLTVLCEIQIPECDSLMAANPPVTKALRRFRVATD